MNVTSEELLARLRDGRAPTREILFDTLDAIRRGDITSAEANKVTKAARQRELDRREHSDERRTS
jgi:hypothetical protein